MKHWTDTRFTKGTILFCGAVIVGMCVYIWGGMAWNILLGCPNCPEPVVDGKVLIAANGKIISDPLLTWGNDSIWIEYPCTDILAALNAVIKWWRKWGYRKCWGLQDSIIVLNERLNWLAEQDWVVMPPPPDTQWHPSLMYKPYIFGSFTRKHATGPKIDSLERYIFRLKDVDTSLYHARRIFCVDMVSIAVVDSLVYKHLVASKRGWWTTIYDYQLSDCSWGHPFVRTWDSLKQARGL